MHLFMQCFYGDRKRGISEMRVNTSLTTVGYRAKGKGEGCAFMVSRPQIDWCGAAHTYGIVVYVRRDTNQDVIGRELHIKPHPEGYELSFKRSDSPQGEISVAYNVLDVQPPIKSTGGLLRCEKARTLSGGPALFVYLTGWIDFQESQSTLFGETGRLLLPRAKSGVIDTDPVVSKEAW
jgi:hypothetical protein